MNNINRRLRQLHPEPRTRVSHAVEKSDDLLAAMYVRMWEVVSGRSLPRNIPPEELSEEELISFWADDLRSYAASGRHAAAAAAAGDKR